MLYVVLTSWFVAHELDANVLPLNSVPVLDELYRPILLMFWVLVTNELALSNVAVNVTALLLELDAAVTAWRFTTSFANVVSVAIGAPPVPNAMCETCRLPAIAPSVYAM